MQARNKTQASKQRRSRSKQASKHASKKASMQASKQRSKEESKQASKQPTDWQTEKQIDRQITKHWSKQTRTNKLSDRQANKQRQTDRQYRQTDQWDWKTERQKARPDRETEDRQTDRPMWQKDRKPASQPAKQTDRQIYSPEQLQQLIDFESFVFAETVLTNFRPLPYYIWSLLFVMIDLHRWCIPNGPEISRSDCNSQHMGIPRFVGLAGGATSWSQTNFASSHLQSSLLNHLSIYLAFYVDLTPHETLSLWYCSYTVKLGLVNSFFWLFFKKKTTAKLGSSQAFTKTFL